MDSVIAGVVDIVGSIDRGGGCLCNDCGRLRVYGLDEVGMEIENVFQIMPMQQQRRCTEGCGRPVCIGNASLTKY